MLEYLFIAFLVISGIQAFFYFIFLLAFPKPKKTTSTSSLPVSIIICAKNEEENLQRHLPIFENQNYSNFELILINDNSSDNTLGVMEQFKATSKVPVKIVDVVPIERFWGSKKFALTLGIKAASHKQLLFTDADCIPLSENWISEMVSGITSEKNIVLGYGKYQKIKKSFLNKIVRFETLLTAIQYFSYAKIGMPYMGVGRNLSYNKKTFFNARGFMNHMHIKSGDDDLFINEVANRKNTVLEVSPQSFTESIPKKTWQSWIQQKRRHISTASSYKWTHKFSLGLYHLSQILFFILFPIVLIFNFKIELVLGVIGLRYLLYFANILNSGRKLRETDLIALAPFYEVFLLLSQIYIFMLNLISKPKHW